MIIDGIIELDDCQFADQEGWDYDIDSLRQAAGNGGSGSIEAMVDLCVAASDLVGELYADPEADWSRAYFDLQACKWSMLNDARVGLKTNSEALEARFRTIEWFNERVRSAVTRFDNEVSAEGTESEGMMATTTTAKRSRAKSEPEALPAKSVFPLVNGGLAWTCTGCGTTNAIDERTCGKCGVQVVLPDVLPQPKRKKAKAIEPEQSPTALESLLEIPLEQISPSELNPRQYFDETALQELAISIENHGLMQPIVVYRVDGPTPFQLIAGERRFRASKLANKPTILARVMTCTHEEAIELRVVENLKRQDLNAIEEGEGFRQMIDRCGYSQRDLATRLGVSQGHIGNRLGLLKLPDVWRQRVITGEITATMGRELVPWADVSAVMAEIEERWNDDSETTREDWSYELLNVIYHVSRPVAGSYWDQDSRKQLTVKIAKKDLANKLLEIRDVPPRHHNGKPEPRAFNIELWKSLVLGREEQAKKKEQDSLNNESPSGKPARSSADEKRLREQQAAAWSKKLYRYKIAWLQTAIATKLDPHVSFEGKDLLLLKLLLHFAATGGAGDRRQGLVAEVHDLGGKEKSRHHHYLDFSDVLSTLSTIPAERLPELQQTLILNWIAGPFEGDSDFTADNIQQLADELEIDFESQYRVDRGLLELATKSTLEAWAKEWKVPVTSTKRGDLLDELEEACAGVKHAPKELVNVKAVRL